MTAAVTARASRARRVSVWMALAVALVFVLIADLLTLWLFETNIAEPYGFWLEGSVLVLSYALLGALVAIRAPENRMGGFLLAVGFVGSVQGVAGALSASAEQLGLSVHDAALLGRLSGGCQVLSVGGIVLLLLLAPNGHALTARWRFVVGITAAGVVSAAIDAMLFGVDQSGGASTAGAGLLLHSLLNLVGAAVPIALISGPLCLWLRWRRSHGLERQQVGWVAIGGIAGPALLLVFPIIPAVQPIFDVLDGWLHGSLIWAMAGAALPAGISVAVLRHRMYNLDRVVSRTLSYTMVTGVLVGIYVLVVTVVSGLLPVSKELAVAAATLAAAAVFRPVLGWARRLVNRRFNREQYNAERVVEDFAVRMRDAVDPEIVASLFLDCVRATVRPVAAAVVIVDKSR